MQRNRLDSLQALRALAVFLITSVHVLNAEARFGGGGGILPAWLGTLGFFGIDLFFVISGFVMVTVTFARDEKPTLAKYAYHRITRIYPTYWFYSLLVLAIFLVRPEMVNSSQGSQVNLLESFLILPQDRLPLVMVGWALEHEMYFYAAFALILLLPKRALVQGLSVWAVIVAAGYYYATVTTALVLQSPALRLVTHPFTFEFIIGCALAQITHGGQTRAGALALLAGASIVVLSTMEFQRLSTSELLDWRRPLLYGVPAALMVYGAAALELRGKISVPRLLVRIGDASYTTFLSHILVISVIGRLWQYFAGPGMIDNLIGTPLMYVGLFVFGEVGYRYIEEPLTSLLRRLEPRVIRSA